MQKKPILKRRWVNGTALVAATALSIALAMPANAEPLAGVESAAVNSEKSYVVDVQYANGIKGKITFLEDDIFRLNVDPTGEFSEYAAPRAKAHMGRIPAQPDSSDKYKHAKPQVETGGGSIVITAGKTTITLDKATAKMTVKSGDKVLVEEASALDLAQGNTVQTLIKSDGEHFFGGGTQNGRIDHTGKVITLDKGGWEDGQVASPSPFYWSTKGYGVLRNTFQNGAYDFGKTAANTVSTSQEENEFDAYFFLSDDKGNAPIAQDLLGDYFQVTGNPVLLPEYGFYLGHLNAYNRDGWSKTQGGKEWKTKGSKPASGDEAEYTRYESGMGAGYVVPENLSAESLNGEGPTVATENMQTKTFDREFSARQVIDDYQNADMPLGWFLPNDGYGAGYGQNGFNKTGDVKADGTSGEQRQAAIDANIDNLRKFTEYANGHGVATGLWTQSYLTPDTNPETKWHLLRDFGKEVETGGISTLKTDVAWVGPGYSMALDGTVSAYNTATTRGDVRPNLITLCGWAGTQRTGAIWSGDQYGGNWEYIRFHIPTFIGQSLSGNPNAGSDMDGIFAGNPVIATRDYQWKTFTTTMLDMDGWGSYRKTPMTHGDPYTGISRMYLKLKAQLMPYLYTSAASAANIDTKNGDTGLPMMRAMFLTDGSDYALSGADNLNYQYTFGNNLLVAPVYENTKGEGVGTGDDVRNGIYLPNYNKEGEEPTIWVDYFTGKQYRGGQVLNNFDAPLWKLPLFVKAGTILPMYEEHNNPQPISKDNPNGLDKTRRVVEFWPAGTSEYTMFEDDGQTVTNDLKEGKDGYGKEANISYGSHVSTHMTSAVKGDKATLTIDASEGTYKGYNPNRVTTMVVNVSKQPTAIKLGGETLNKVNDKAALDKLSDSQSGWCYVEEPNLNTGSVDHPEEAEFAKIEMKTTPKVYIKLARTDVSKNTQSVVVEGFENKADMGKDTLNANLAAPANLQAPEDRKTPTSIDLTWAPVADATSYEVKVDGTVNAVGNVQEFNHKGLGYKSTHTYQVRARNAEGYSAWSEPALVTESLEDPWRNVPEAKVTWTGDYYNNQTEAIAFDHDLGKSHFHSDGSAVSNKDTLTVDFGLAYKLDQLEYFPRDDYGNGTVTKMKIETSLDGNNWTELTTTNWNWGAKQGSEVVPFGDVAARYVRLTPVQASGGFFSAREIKITKDDGTDGFAVGSTGFKPTISDADLQNITQYKGLENRGADKAAFDQQVAARYCDLNDNGVYDVYDYAFALSQYNGGTKQEGAVSGSLIIVPDKASAKAGETVTFTLYADGAKNVNALGALLNFNSADFTYVDKSLKATSYVGAMEDLSIAKTVFPDGKQTINLAFVNKGDMPLFDGSAALASFQLTAKRDMDASAFSAATTATPYKTFLIGPACDVVEYTYDGSVDIPAKPETTASELAQSDFSQIAITNANVPEVAADGNMGKFIQQGNANGLFNGNNSDRGFEFKWFQPQDAASFDKDIALPATISFTLKTPRPLSSVSVHNGKPLTSNGTVTSLKAAIYFEDGSKQEFAGGEYDTTKELYTFTVAAENAGKKVAKVEIIPLTSTGSCTGIENPENRMLTLSEIDFNYTTPGVTATDIELGANKIELYVDDLTRVQAKVLPYDERYPYFTVSVKDPAVATASEVQNADGSISWFLRANKPGKTEVTVASLANPDVKKSYTLTVKEGVDSTELEQAIAAANRHHESAYTPQSYKALVDAKAEGQALLESGAYTKDQVHSATVKIEKAMDALELRKLDFDSHFNKDASSGVVVVKANSSAAESPYTNALDYDESTFWHSNYGDSDVLPDYVIYDLGSEHVLTDVAFKTRQDGATNGDIFEAQVYVADSAEALDGDGRGTLLGTFKFDNNGKVLNNREDWQQMTFAPTATRFVKIEATRSGGGEKNAYAAISETRFYEQQDEKLADVQALTTLVNQYKAENLKAENFTERTWTPFANLMKDAEALIANPPAAADQARVDELAKNLEAARKGLVEKAPEPEKPSKTQLNELIAKAQKAETDGKTPAVVDEFNAAFENAVAVAGDEGATEDQVKDAYTRLNEALAKLEADAGNGNGGTGNGGTGNGGNGGTGNGGQTGGGNGGSAGQTGTGGQTGSGDKLAQTGDATAIAVAAAGGLGGVFAALGAKLRRRKRD